MINNITLYMPAIIIMLASLLGIAAPAAAQEEAQATLPKEQRDQVEASHAKCQERNNNWCGFVESRGKTFEEWLQYYRLLFGDQTWLKTPVVLQANKWSDDMRKVKLPVDSYFLLRTLE